jgi:hypothetical protein
VDEARTAALWRVSAGIASPAGLFVDEAIQLAVEMLDEGDQRGAILTVAALSPSTSQADAIEPVIDMLAALKIDVVQSAASEPDKTHLMFKAFANGGLSVEQFEGHWWNEIPPYHEQTDTQRRVTILLDQLDHESNPARQAAVTDEIRNLLRHEH